MRFRQVPIDDVDWDSLDRYKDRTYSQRLPWLRYLMQIKAGTPIVALLEDGNREVGCFTGVRTTRLGVPIMGSPLPGWNTANMGLNLQPEIPRSEVLRALARFVFREQHCAYLEVSDPVSDIASAEQANYSINTIEGYVSDLTLSELELFGRMAPACRRCIRKAEREGVVVEMAEPEGFAAEFYSQLTEVFLRQDLTPVYSQARVQALIDQVYSSGMLLLLRAKAPDGQSIATGIFPGFGRYSIFWANASVQNMRHLRPNQALHWYAMRYWKARGVLHHDWGGVGSYKKNYGGGSHTYVRQFKSVVPLLDRLRQPALTAYKRIRSWRSRTATVRAEFTPVSVLSIGAVPVPPQPGPYRPIPYIKTFRQN